MKPCSPPAHPKTRLAELPRKSPPMKAGSRISKGALARSRQIYCCSNGWSRSLSRSPVPPSGFCCGSLRKSGHWDERVRQRRILAGLERNASLPHLRASPVDSVNCSFTCPKALLETLLLRARDLGQQISHEVRLPLYLRLLRH